MIMQTFTFNDGSLKKKKIKVQAFYLEKNSRTLFFSPKKGTKHKDIVLGKACFFVFVFVIKREIFSVPI